MQSSMQKFLQRLIDAGAPARQECRGSLSCAERKSGFA